MANDQGAGLCQGGVWEIWTTSLVWQVDGARAAGWDGSPWMLIFSTQCYPREEQVGGGSSSELCTFTDDEEVKEMDRSLLRVWRVRRERHRAHPTE